MKIVDFFYLNSAKEVKFVRFESFISEKVKFLPKKYFLQEKRLKFSSK
jgi:hypothetical protein